MPNKKILADSCDQVAEIGASRSGDSLELHFKKIFREISVGKYVDAVFARVPGLFKKTAALRIYINSSPAGREIFIKPGDDVALDGLFGMKKATVVLPCRERPRVVFEDDFIAAVDKPPGVLVHPDAPDNTSALTNMLAAHFASTGQKDRAPLHIHRIDTGTSGIVIFAKDPVTLSLLDAAMFAGGVERSYVARVEGRVRPPAGKIDLPLGRDRHDARKFRVSNKGKESVTNYRTLSYDAAKDESLLEISLETGRPHQIRVHFSHLGHPVSGDALYGSGRPGRPGPGFMLHSCRASFIHPYSFARISVSTPRPF